jgi:tRNA U38,U39,U40 pseudouridine synthase TruA
VQVDGAAVCAPDHQDDYIRQQWQPLAKHGCHTVVLIYQHARTDDSLTNVQLCQISAASVSWQMIRGLMTLLHELQAGCTQHAHVSDLFWLHTSGWFLAYKHDGSMLCARLCSEWQYEWILTGCS